MAFLLNTDGTRGEVKPKNGKYFSLEEMQQMVDGHIDIRETTDEDGMHCLIVNEEGKCKNMDYNPEATVRYKYHLWNGVFNDIIVGPAIYGLKSEMFEEDYEWEQSRLRAGKECRQ